LEAVWAAYQAVKSASAEPEAADDDCVASPA